VDQSIRIKPRSPAENLSNSISKITSMSADECAHRAAELLASAYDMKPGDERQSVLKKACEYRAAAEVKRVMVTPKITRKGSSPMG
jgi:hypothetical protein